MVIGDWFDKARLGLFVHWDHASQQGLEVSWPMVGGLFALPKCQSVSLDEYNSSAATFDPKEWDAEAIIHLARRAGMRYAVFTAKHHSGYSMNHTSLSDFSVEHSPCGRDLLGEFVEACRKEGLRVGIYFSLSDWHHPDYPAVTEADKPYALGATPPLPSEPQRERYLEFMFGQIRELLTHYGKVDLIWFDGGWERPAAWWKPNELAAMIRSIQPEILINDRLPWCGDFATPEQAVPMTPPAGRWETCLTMNDSWGYNPGDTSYKSTRRLVHTVCEVAGKGGNLLLNVSPTGDGSLPSEQVERLEGMAAWMSRNSDSVHNTSPGLDPWQWYGSSTRHDNRIFCHMLWRPYEDVSIRGLPVRRIRSISEMGSGRELDFTARTGIVEGLTQDPVGEVTVAVPADVVDPVATVLEIQITPPRH